jgi:hypothetical protein
MFASVQNLYRVETPAERREVAAKSMAKYAPVTSPKFEEMGEEMRIGELYRMPPPRRP